MDVLGAEVLGRLGEQEIELPSWAFGNSGTRFKVFAQPGVPRDPFEKVADAAKVHELTGLAPRVALHIPWDKVDEYGVLKASRASLASAWDGQLQHLPGRHTSSVAPPRRQGGAAAGRRPPSRVSGGDGSDRVPGPEDLARRRHNYPGQDIRARQEWLLESLHEIYAHLGGLSQRPLPDYKFFEPAFYHTDVPDWGTAFAHARELGPQAFVCLDTGHHAPGTNIEFIVTQLLRLGEGRLVRFNSRFYADDDLSSGRPTRSSCSGSCSRWSAAAGTGGTPGSSSCSTSATTSRRRSRPDPVGPQRPGDDRPGPAGRPRRARRRAGRR